MGTIICICCENPSERARLSGYARRFGDEENVELGVRLYESDEKLLCDRTSVLQTADILLLEAKYDISAAKELFSGGFEGGIVLFSERPDFAAESYLINAAGYLLKPVAYPDFARAMLRFRSRGEWEKDSRALEFISDRCEVSVHLREVLFIETRRGGCILHSFGAAPGSQWSVFSTSRTIGSFEEETSGDASFMRLGKSFIVNLNHIRELTRESLIMKSGDVIPLPVRERVKLSREIRRYIWTRS